MQTCEDDYQLINIINTLFVDTRKTKITTHMAFVLAMKSAASSTFKYIGNKITSDGGTNADITLLISTAMYFFSPNNQKQEEDNNIKKEDAPIITSDSESCTITPT